MNATPNQTAKRKQTYSRVRWTDVDALVTRVKTTLRITDTQLAGLLGVSVSGLSGWRNTNDAPAWLPLALRGLLVADQPATQLTTDEHIELMANALSAFTGNRTPSFLKLQAGILREHARRIEAQLEPASTPLQPASPVRDEPPPAPAALTGHPYPDSRLQNTRPTK